MSSTGLKWLTGCAGLTAVMLTACQSAPTRIYTPYAVPPAAAHDAYAGPPLRVDAVHFPPALDRIEIVRDIGRGEMSLSDVDHWSAPLGQAARQALSADLVARLPPGKTVFPHLTKPGGALGLTVDVLDFTTDSRGASLQAGWAISTPGQSAAVASGTATFHSDAATFHSDAAAGGAEATVRALSTLLGLLADRIVAAL